MRKSLNGLFRLFVAIFAIIGVFFILLIIFVPKSTPRAIPSTDTPSLAVLAPTATPTPPPDSPTPIPTAVAPTPLPTSTPALVMVKTNNAANLRSGPGTEYPVVGNLQAGATVTITGRTDAGDWYSTHDGNWIAAFLFDSIPAVPTIPPTVTPTLTPTAAPLTESAYGQFIKRWADDFMNALNQFVELTGTPGADFSSAAKTMGNLESELHTVEPPANFYNFHQLLITTLESCHSATEYARDGQNSMASIQIRLCLVGVELAIDKLETEH